MVIVENIAKNQHDMILANYRVSIKYHRYYRVSMI